MNADLSHNNTRRYISILQLAAFIGPEMSDSLLGLHAFTGSDYTFAFKNKRNLKLLALTRPYQEQRKAQITGAGIERCDSGYVSLSW